MRSLVKGAAIVLALVSIGVAAFFGWKIYQTEKEYQEGAEAYDLIAQIAAGTEDAEPGEIPASSVPAAENGNTQGENNGTDVTGENGSDVTDNDEKSTENQASQTSETESANISPDLPEIDFKALQQVNPQIIGWIYSPDTAINYPVVQGDDNEYYLHHLADSTWNSSGCPFLDVKNRADFSDENSIIYAHHMQNGTMFAGITWYAEQDYFEQHPVLYLITKEHRYMLEPFAGYTTTMDSSAYMLTFSDRHEFAEWIREVSKKSDFRAALTISTHDRILTLSTCAYSFQDARYVLHCRMKEL